MSKNIKKIVVAAVHDVNLKGKKLVFMSVAWRLFRLPYLRMYMLSGASSYTDENIRPKNDFLVLSFFLALGEIHDDDEDDVLRSCRTFLWGRSFTDRWFGFHKLKKLHKEWREGKRQLFGCVFFVD